MSPHSAESFWVNSTNQRRQRITVSDTQNKQIKELEKAVARLQVKVEDCEDVLLSLSTRHASVVKHQNVMARILQKIEQRLGGK